MTIEDLVRSLNLAPHPEGGWYAETWRSDSLVTTADGRSRAAGTHIHFLLAAGQVSRWHRVTSDELWMHRDGAPLELWIADPDASSARRFELAAASDEALVPPGYWQAARSLGDWSLCSCVVTPGFDFADFTLLQATDSAADPLAAAAGNRDFHPVV